MDRKWRVGLIGVGRGSGYGRLLAEEPRCEVVALCDASADALARFQEGLGLPDEQCHQDFDEFLACDLDIVFVGTPIPLHAEQSIKAMEAGCHVLSEVTMAPNIEECWQIAEATRRTGQTYMLAENCVFWHFVSVWREMVEAGKLGTVVYAEAEYLHPIPSLIYDPETGETKWRINRAPLHYCSHSLGPILDMTGDRIVKASGVGTSNHIFGRPEMGAIDLQVALFQTEKGMTIKLLRTSLLPRERGLHFYSLHGTNGFIESDRASSGGTGRYFVKGETEANTEMVMPLSDPNLPESAQAGGHGTAEYSLLRDFLGALEEGRKPRIDEARGIDITVPGLVAHESAMKGGEWLDVPKFE